MTTSPPQPSVIPVTRPLSLIPVGLKEAALDSPSFRSAVVHYSDQIDAVEKWLDGYVKAASKLATEVGVLEDVVNTFLTASNPPDELSEAVLDHDYAIVAMRRYGQGAHEFWSHAIGGFKKSQKSVIEPIRATLAKDFRPFKDSRRVLEQTQKSYDAALARYASQAKSKEASSLREDAFQLHVERKAYLKASMDFCIFAPSLRAALDTLLIKVFSDQWLEMKDLRESVIPTIFSGYGHEIERIRNWSQHTNQGEFLLRRELTATRRRIEESAETATRPSRDLEEYSAFTAPSLGARPRASSRVAAEGSSALSKQGWLFMRTTAGRPARTTWIRRWFFVKNGVFGWLTQGSKSGGVEESEKIGVLLCSVRAAAQEERRFCFEVKTKDTMLMLQAETQNELVRWLSVFDAAKKKALEEPAAVSSYPDRPSTSSDAAFAVSPAFSPELAATSTIDETLSTPRASMQHEQDGSIVGRESSFRKRRATALFHSEGDSTRDQAAKILSKLDLHRKSTASPIVSNRTISASMPTSPAAARGPTSMTSTSTNALTAPPPLYHTNSSASNIFAGSSSNLAPACIATPPLPTNLSKTAVMVVAERGLEQGIADATGGAPSSLLSNVWGTANYGHISRLERGEVVRARTSIAQTGEPVSPSVAENDQATGTLSVMQKASASQQSIAANSFRARTGHRKTVSEASAHVQPQQAVTSAVEYPDYYPLDLRIHDAQLRLLFPNIPVDDRVLLVFRASWNPSSESQDLPGRVYVTNNEFYFYSNYHGFILVTGHSMSRVMHVSAETTSTHDLLHFTLRDVYGKNDVYNLTMKVYLEPLQLLRRRLEYIVSTYNAQDPISLQEMVSTLINLDNDSLDPSPEPEDWEHVTRSRYFESPTRGAKKELKADLKVDRSLYGGDSTSMLDADPQQFKLPAQPVEYKPQDALHIAAEGTFDISAKAMFHLLFGDKSAISQILYFQRRTKMVKQYPWAMVDGAHWSRRFEYEVTVNDGLSNKEDILIVDSQTIDVLNEHLCYCVTDLKTPWHLPRPYDFSLMTKIVVTHSAKSKCKLAVFTKVQWRKRSGFSDRIIEKHAYTDLSHDAVDLLAMVTDQVAKLSKADAQTRKAVEIFGHLGHITDPAQILAPDLTVLSKTSIVRVSQRTMTELAQDAILSILETAVTNVVAAILDAVKLLGKSLGAHGMLLTLLAISILTQLFTSSTLIRSWYADRSAASYMARLGVGADATMGRAVYLHDIYDVAYSATTEPTPGTNQCSHAFNQLLAIDGGSSPLDQGYTMQEPSLRGTARRLHSTRQRMGRYRHDLLVSLRLINNIERETIQAEYETWVLEENAKCDHIAEVLEAYAMHNATTNNQTALDVRARRLSSLRDLQTNYCADCRHEQKMVLARRL